MTPWQRLARLLIAIFAIAFALFVALAIKSRGPAVVAVSVTRTDPNSVVESSGGRVMRFKRAHEDVNVQYDRQLTYADGTTKLLVVTVVTEERNGARTFTVTGREGLVSKDEATITLTGDVNLVASDGLRVQTEHAIYTESDGMIRASGPVEFSRNRMTGSGLGMSYDRNRDVMTIVDQAIVHLAPDEGGVGAVNATSGTATYASRENYVRFERTMKVQRAGQVIEADSGVAYLDNDEERIDRVELRGNARITVSNAGAGGLQLLAGQEMNLKYAPDGQALEHAHIVGGAVVQLAGEAGQSGRQITADMLDIALAADGSTPTALVGRNAVQLAFPAEQGQAARTIRATTLDAKGPPDRGLTNAMFGGNVEYRERSATIDRVATSGALDVALRPGMSAIQEAKFEGAVRFEEGRLTAKSANARYILDKGLLELSGSEPGTQTPHVVNEQISIDATRIDVTLDGPKLSAKGDVRSTLQPTRNDPTGKDSRNDTKIPSMLKPDQPVAVVGTDLDYDGATKTAIYRGNVQLFQVDTVIKADTITVDANNGDLAASGAVTTTTILEHVDKATERRERVRSIVTASELMYEESLDRATYTGDVHISGPQGDMAANKIELYLKPSGKEIDRAEAYDNVTLREQNRKTTGTRMTYTAADDRYIVTGTPMKIVEACGRETTGKTLTFIKATDTININGNGFRTLTTERSGQCP